MPDLLPSSFEGNRGHIRYKVGIVLDVPMGFDKEYEAPFTVFKHENLNIYPALRMPIEKQVRESFCVFPCQTGVMYIKTSMPYCGFTPGQIIQITLDINNKSKVSVKRIKMSISRNLQYICDHPKVKSENNSDIMCEASGAGFLAQKTETKVLSIEVPKNVCCTSSHCCRVIKWSYEVIITFETNGMFHSNPVIKLPIFIGSMPFAFQTPINNAPPSAPLLAPPLDQPLTQPSAPPNADLDLRKYFV